MSINHVFSFVIVAYVSVCKPYKKFKTKWEAENKNNLGYSLYSNIPGI